MFHEAGLNYVYQIFGRNCEISPFEFWENKGVSHKFCLKYNAIVNVIVKNKWKYACNDELIETFHTEEYGEKAQFEFLVSEVQKLKTKTIYWDFVQEIFSRPVCEHLFSNVYEIEESEWSQIYTLPFKCTIEVKLREFQFKILHNILYTNDRLYKMKIVSSNICSFCSSDIETPIHLFYECDITTKLRQEFVERLGDTFDLKLDDANKKRMMVGFIKDWKGPHVMLLNHLILMLKRYIYIQKCQNKTLDIEGLLSFISHVRFIENTIAKRSIKSQQIHYKKWSPLEDLI